MKGTTKTGFAFELADNAADNMELLDALAETDSNPLALSRVVLLLLGADQRSRLYDHVRQADGRVPVADVNRELMDVIGALGKTGKN